jgi:hypothetical protein
MNSTTMNHARRSSNSTYLEAEDIRQALSYAAWRAEEVEVPLAST